MDSRGVALFFDVLVALARRFLSARNRRRRTLCADDAVATLVAQAHLHQMSPRDREMAATERLVHSARRVTA